MRSLFVVRSPHLKRFVIAAFLAIASAGCTDKACLRWNENDRKLEESATGGAAGAGGTGGAGGSGGMGGAGGAAGAADAGAMTGTGGATGADGGTDEVPPIVCPSRARALEILGKPSCTEAIQSLDSDGVYDPDSDQCCYEVTTKTQPCGEGGG